MPRAIFPLMLQRFSRTMIAGVAALLGLAGAAIANSPQAPPPAAASATAAPGTTQSPLAPDTPPPADTAVGDSTTAKKSKKVWTNEDVPAIRGPVSIVGDARNAKGKSAALTPADPQYVAEVRKQLEKLQKQMADIDKELATLKDFSEGEPVATSDREFHKNYNSQPILQQMTNLKTKKKDLQSKIDALLDEARKKGVEPGQLR